MLSRTKPTKLIKPYVIAIPSYQRPEQLFKKTIATLSRLLEDTIPPIYIFLADMTEYKLYSSAAKNYKSSIQHLKIKFVIGTPGLVSQRNFIIQWFKSGQHIIGMDDDVEGFYRLNTFGHPERSARASWRLESLLPGELNKLIDTGFTMLDRYKAHLWGIYPVDNPYFMTPGMSTDLKFIVGPFYGIINRPGMLLTTPAKNNVERTLQNYSADGAVIRFNNYTLRTQYYKIKGGLQATNAGNIRRQKAEAATEHLHKLYPALTIVKHTKKAAWPELKLINKTRKLKKDTN